MTDNDLNEQVNVTVDDASVITVPIDATLQNSNEAADAKAVGDALALKADKSELQAAVKVNNQPADAQGLILIDGRHIPVSDQDTETLANAVTDLKGKTAADIPMSSDSGAKTIAEVVNANSEAIEGMEEMTGATMPIESGSQTTVKAAIEARVKTVNRKAPDADGDVDLSVVPLAENLQSDKIESVEGSFIIRTTGGNASVSDGKAYPLHLFGAAEHTGYVAEELNMTVIPITRTEPDEPITATIDRDTFVAYVDESSTINLYYTTEWSADPELYGITVTGTPEAGDQITVVYVKEVRGTITVANPVRLVGTGWNLFDYNNGYARVVKYSTEYGYKIGGSYASLQFSATLTGERSSITPGVDGLFNVPSDGYVFVTGGNNKDTYILTTWSDWMEGPSSGYWEPYRESGIDLSAVMTTYFPNGLLAVVTTRDEIDLSAKRSISRIERMAYSEENRAAAAASGRSYDFDQNYIYIVRESAVISAITIDTTYNVSEHGLEWFTETTLPVISEILYGKNLRDKLERDVVTISAQTLTEEEKAQVRTNIGAMSQADGDTKLVAPTAAGTAGQLLHLKADGGTEWTTQGTPTDAQVGTAVSAWLTAHPEATTTVEDGAISRAKLNDDLKAKTDAVPDLKSALNTIDDYFGEAIQGEVYEELNRNIDSSGEIITQANWKMICFKVVAGEYIENVDGSFDRYAYYTSKPTLGSISYNSSRTVSGNIKMAKVPNGCSWLCIAHPNDGRVITITPNSFMLADMNRKIRGNEQTSKIQKEIAYTAENSEIPYLYTWHNGGLNGAANPSYSTTEEYTQISIDRDMWVYVEGDSTDTAYVRKKDSNNQVTTAAAPVVMHFSSGDTLNIQRLKGHEIKVLWIDNPNRIYDECDILSEIGTLKGYFIQDNGNIYGGDANSYITSRVFIAPFDGWAVFENNKAIGNSISARCAEYNQDGVFQGVHDNLKYKLKKGYQYRFTTYQSAIGKVMFYKNLPDNEGIVNKIEVGIMTDGGGLYTSTAGYRLTLATEAGEWLRVKLATGYHVGFLRPDNATSNSKVLNGFKGIPYMDVVINYSNKPYITIYSDDESSVTLEDYSDIVESIERINKRGSAGYDIVIAASNSTALDKKRADLVCDGENDEYELNLAVNCTISAAGERNTKVLLLAGDYILDSFHENKFAQLSVTAIGKTAIEIKKVLGTGRNTVTIDGSGEMETTIKMSASAYSSVESEVSIIGTDRKQDANYPVIGSTNNMIFFMSNLRVLSYDWGKPIVCVDGAGMTMIGLDKLNIHSEIEHYSPTWDTELENCNDGFIGIRGISGSNWGHNAFIKRTGLAYMGQGLALTGEHFIIEDIGIHSCKVGITVGNFKVTGQMEHPNVFIGCGIEKCYRLGILTKEGITTEQTYEEYRNNGGTGNMETIVYIGGSSEAYWTDSNGVGHGSLPIKEVVKGAYHGRIEMDLNSKIFEAGSGTMISTIRYGQGGVTYVHNVGVEES